MPLEFKDRVKDQTNTTGTGTLTIDGVAPTGYRTITAAHTTGRTVRYTVINGSGSEWEVGEGVWTSAGSTLTRATVYSSSNGGALVNFSAGAKAVFTGPVAADRNGTIDTNLAFTGTGLRITGDLSNATASSRVLFQTSTANSQSNVGVMPSGTDGNAQFQAYNSSDPNNASIAAFAAASGTVRIVSSNSGTGTLLPIAFVIGATEAARIDTSGRWGLGQISPLARLDVSGNQACNIVAVAALNIDCSAGNFFTKTINANSTFTVSNVPASRAYAFTLELTHTSGTVTWFSGVQWPGGTAPTLTTSKVHLFTFVTDDGGTSWRGASQVNYNS